MWGDLGEVGGVTETPSSIHLVVVEAFVEKRWIAGEATQIPLAVNGRFTEL